MKNVKSNLKNFSTGAVVLFLLLVVVAAGIVVVTTLEYNFIVFAIGASINRIHFFIQRTHILDGGVVVMTLY